MVLASDVALVKRAIESEPPVLKWFEAVRADAEQMLSAKPIEHKLIGPRLLDKSRTCLNRVTTLAGVYRLTGDKRFAERAKLEMLTAAGFPDWNPKHFLDTAEMTSALAIGYDWLFDYLSPDERATIRKAIVELGLKEGLKVYEADRWWAKATHNWNQVCNGGMTVGALAIAEEDSVLARRVVNYARRSIPRAMASFAPDGGWNEGPGYWGYTTMYTAFFLSAVETALGTDFGIQSSPGYRDTGYFRMHFIGPTGRTFNYADAHDAAGSAYQMMWMGRALDRPLYAAHERSRVERPSIFHLLWWGGRGQWPAESFPLAGVWKGVDVALMRTSWTDSKAIWIGFKGGDNQANHSHLDLGTFNLDALGQRWALDLGGDDYNMADYFGKKRWTYYRLRTEGHNTLTIDDENQDPRAAAPLVAFSDRPDRMFAVAELKAAYGGKLAKWSRGIGIFRQRQVVVIDEVAARPEAGSVKVTWNFHTAAKVETAGREATLSAGRATWRLHVVSPADAKFVTVPGSPPPPENPNRGVTNLTIELPGKVATTTIGVVMGSADDAQEAKVPGSLDEWIREAPLGR
jgi:hypothetical protein